jgi:hypothetical protein
VQAPSGTGNDTFLPLTSLSRLQPSGRGESHFPLITTQRQDFHQASGLKETTLRVRNLGSGVAVGAATTGVFSERVLPRKECCLQPFAAIRQRIKEPALFQRQGHAFAKTARRLPDSKENLDKNDIDSGYLFKALRASQR